MFMNSSNNACFVEELIVFLFFCLIENLPTLLNLITKFLRNVGDHQLPEADKTI